MKQRERSIWAASLMGLAMAGLGTGCDSQVTAVPQAEASVSIEQKSEELHWSPPPTARLIASGIPGAAHVAQIMPFRGASPNVTNPTFAAMTTAGQIGEAKRLFVTSTSNFGAPLARPGEPEGAILSIDPTVGPLAVPNNFATAGDQASAAGGAIRLYTAQSPAFLNGVNNPAAATAAFPAVSLPQGISINNGNGRPWFANSPNGAGGDGSISVLDLNGRPLAGAPSPVSAGVFIGAVSNRDANTVHGLTNGAVSTAIITRSSDNSTRAVFAAALADGSIVQVHVQKGVDQLAPPGTFTPIGTIDRGRVESNSRHVITRAGMAFNWAPTFILYVADGAANRIVVLDMGADGTLFTTAAPRYFRSWAFDRPVDVAPTSPEVANGNFSSATTLGGGSDLYVLNRGNNTIVRINQNGDFLAIREIRPDTSLPGFRATGLGVSSDGLRIYVTGTGNGGEGYVVEMDSFGEGLVTGQLLAMARNDGVTRGIRELGANIFSRQFGVFQFVGPLFNGQACSDCHTNPAPGGGDVRASSEFRVGRMNGGVFDPLIGLGGPVARNNSISDLGFYCGLQTGAPPLATMTSPRSAMTLRGTSLIDSIQEKDIRAIPATQPAEIRGKLNILADGRLGRFGWKADSATLVEFMGDAFRTEQGVTNHLAPRDLVNGCGANILRPEMDGLPIQAVTEFMTTINPAAPSATCLSSPGATVFSTIGCAGCHVPTIASEGAARRIYSDLLLHDMGPALADGFVQGSATGSEWRTMPLWGLNERDFFLHDGRATTVSGAIEAHGGQGAAAAAAFSGLSAADRQALLDFLGCI